MRAKLSASEGDCVRSFNINPAGLLSARECAVERALYALREAYAILRETEPEQPLPQEPVYRLARAARTPGIWRVDAATQCAILRESLSNFLEAA